MTLSYNSNPKTWELIQWLQFCWERMVAGQPIPRKPGFKSPKGEITLKYANSVISAVERQSAREIANHPQYHWNRSKSDLPVDFSALSDSDRLGLAEGVDRILYSNAEE